jgi:hypothetical protein
LSQELERDECRTLVLVALGLAVAIALLHHETLFGGRIYNADDLEAGYFPSHVAILRALSAGELPEWEPRAWGGFPLIAVPYYGIFYPPNALFWVLGAARAVAWLVAIHQFAAGLAMFVFLRRGGLSPAPASFGAFAYALCTFSVERIRHLPFQQMLAWIPLLLLGLRSIVDPHSRRGIALVAIAIGSMCLAGAEPLLPFVLAIAAAYVVPQALAARSLRVWGDLAIGSALGLGIGAAQLVPTVWHLPLSPRALGTSYAFASSYAWPDLRWLVTLLVPDFFGVPHGGRWFGVYNHWELAGYYVGALTVVMAFAAPLTKKPELAALTVLSALAVGIALGDAGPIHPLLYRYLPGYGSLRCPARALVILVVTLPILAAEGTHRLEGIQLSQGSLRWWLCAVGVSVLTLLIMGSHGSPMNSELDIRRSALHHLVLQALALSGCGALVTAGVLPSRGTWLATALLVADLLTIGRGYLETSDPESVTALTRVPAIQRMLSVVGDDRAAVGKELGRSSHNLGLVADFRSLAGYDSFPVWRWVELLWIASAGHRYPHRELGDDLAKYTPRLESPLADALNVRWCVSTEAPGPNWAETVGGNPAEKYRLFENAQAMPPAFLVHQVRVEPDSDGQAEAVSRIDPKREVVLDAEPTPRITGSDTPAMPASIMNRTRTRLRIKTHDPNDAVLVVSETMYPGWKAAIDEHAATVHYADYALRGVAVPAGEHVVEMWFEPPWGHFGEASSFASFGMVLGLAMVSIFERDRKVSLRRRDNMPS